MAPIRRYLRITKYSVLECRIYLDNPALAHSWLLNPRDPVLPRIIDAVRPLVLPKLREERERNRNKRSTKKKGIKDVVAQDDFQVSIFLTETNTRHSLLTKHKHFHDKSQTKLVSNSGHLVGASSEAPVHLEPDDRDYDADAVPMRREDSDDEGGAGAALANIPEHNNAVAGRPPKRSRADSGVPGVGNTEDDKLEIISDEDQSAEEGASDDEDGLFVEAGEAENTGPPPSKRRRGVDQQDQDDDKKKLAMDISYEGFSIYGRVLCLVVKRTDGAKGPASASTATPKGASKASAGARGQVMMENFIMSTQLPAGTETEAPA